VKKSFFLESPVLADRAHGGFRFVQSALTLVLYLLGVPGVPGRHQILLLTLLRLTLLAGILSALTYLRFHLPWAARAGRLVLCFLSIAYSGALLLVTGFLSAWFQLPN
jgi:hypothetical protein